MAKSGNHGFFPLGDFSHNVNGLLLLIFTTFRNKSKVKAKIGPALQYIRCATTFTYQFVFFGKQRYSVKATSPTSNELESDTPAKIRFSEKCFCHTEKKLTDRKKLSTATDTGGLFISFKVA